MTLHVHTYGFVFSLVLSALSLFPFHLLDSMLLENTGINMAVNRSGIPYRRPHPIEKFDPSPNLDLIPPLSCKMRGRDAGKLEISGSPG